MHKVDLDVKCHEFYGLIPPRFCGEIKTVIYNEFLTATRTIKEKLLEVILLSVCLTIISGLHPRQSYITCFNDKCNNYK